MILRLLRFLFFTILFDNFIPITISLCTSGIAPIGFIWFMENYFLGLSLLFLKLDIWTFSHNKHFQLCIFFVPWSLWKFLRCFEKFYSHPQAIVLGNGTFRFCSAFLWNAYFALTYLCMEQASGQNCSHSRAERKALTCLILSGYTQTKQLLSSKAFHPNIPPFF